MSPKRKSDKEILDVLHSSNHPLTDEQLSAVSILLEIGVGELYLMTLDIISSKVKRTADKMKLSPEKAFLKVGAHIMLYEKEAALTDLVKVLGLIIDPHRK